MRGRPFDFERDNKWNNIERVEPVVTTEDFLRAHGQGGKRKVFEFNIGEDIEDSADDECYLDDQLGFPQEQDMRRTVANKKDLKADKSKRKQKEKERGTQPFEAEQCPIPTQVASLPVPTVVHQKIPPFVFKPKYRLNRADQAELIVPGEQVPPEEQCQRYPAPDNSLSSAGELQVPENDSLDISSVVPGSHREPSLDDSSCP